MLFVTTACSSKPLRGRKKSPNPYRNIYPPNLSLIYLTFPPILYTNIASNSQKEKELFIKGKNSVYLGFNYLLDNSGITLEYKNHKFGSETPLNWDYALRHNRMFK